MTLYPILRTEDMQPYTAFVGEVVEEVMTLSIASKDLFTLGVMVCSHAKVHSLCFVYKQLVFGLFAAFDVMVLHAKAGGSLL